MKRDNVICLSTSLGDTYYLQTTSQAEVDSWIRAIHSGTYVHVLSIIKSMVVRNSRDHLWLLKLCILKNNLYVKNQLQLYWYNTNNAKTVAAM